jgi:hypothetical protein
MMGRVPAENPVASPMPADDQWRHDPRVLHRPIAHRRRCQDHDGGVGQLLRIPD